MYNSAHWQQLDNPTYLTKYQSLPIPHVAAVQLPKQQCLFCCHWKHWPSRNWNLNDPRCCSFSRIYIVVISTVVAEAVAVAVATAVAMAVAIAVGKSSIQPTPQAHHMCQSVEDDDSCFHCFPLLANGRDDETSPFRKLLVQEKDLLCENENGKTLSTLSHAQLHAMTGNEILSHHERSITKKNGSAPPGSLVALIERVLQMMFLAPSYALVNDIRQ